MRFKIGDKVVLNKNSNWFDQQEFDDNGKPIPLTITGEGNIYGYQYEACNNKLYDDIDLEPYSENTEFNYEVY